MCSFLFSTKKPENIDFVNFFLKKRGPDATNVVYHGDHTFIHNLLSMTGEFTLQPIVNKEETVYVLFNGEIYNYKSFGDYDNDSKCILPLYEKYGVEFARHLDGEFSICIVDYSNDTMFTTTDAFATKPLWIAHNDQQIGCASYQSGVSCFGYQLNQMEKVPANTSRVYKLSTHEKLWEGRVYTFELTQHKKDFNDWNIAFSESIRKRCVTNVREGIFIGLSSGYDSGALACEMKKQNVSFNTYTLSGTENQNILEQRFSKLGQISKVLPKSPQVLAEGKKYINEIVEEFMYQTSCARSNYNEFNLRLHDDNGSSGLSVICSLAKKDNKKIYLSGQGADELFSDYGFNGQSKYNHSNFGGKFPEDLSTIFPKAPDDKNCIWRSFYGSSMISYLAKEEYVGGGYGLEGRYPFLDKNVVQEFLWLDHTLKNSVYKAPLDNYLKQNNFPYSPGEKIGF